MAGSVSKQAQPRLGPDGSSKADTLCYHEGRRPTGERDAQSAPLLASADVHADHSDEHSTNPEDERHDETFQARSGSEARDLGGAKPTANERGRDRDRQIGLK